MNLYKVKKHAGVDGGMPYIMVIPDTDDVIIPCWYQEDAPDSLWDDPQIRRALLTLPERREELIELAPHEDIEVRLYEQPQAAEDFQRCLAQFGQDPSEKKLAALAKAHKHKDEILSLTAGYVVDEYTITEEENPRVSCWLYVFVGPRRPQYKWRAIRIENRPWQELSPWSDVHDWVMKWHPTAKMIGYSTVPWRTFDWRAHLAEVQNGEDRTRGDFIAFVRTSALWYGLEHGACNKALRAAENGEDYDPALCGFTGYVNRWFEAVKLDSIPRAMRRAHEHQEYNIEKYGVSDLSELL